MKCEKCIKYTCIVCCTVNTKEEHHSFNDLPACEYSDGDKYWYLNGKLHRADGPACEYLNESKHWYLNGIEAIQILRQELYIQKTIQIEDKIGIILNQKNNLFWEALIGDEKELVVGVL